MALIHALMRLKNQRFVISFEFIGTSRRKANAHLSNNKIIVLYMGDDYIVGATEVREGCLEIPVPDYIIYNQWDKVTEEAFDEAKRLGTKLVSFGKLLYIVEEMTSKND